MRGIGDLDDMDVVGDLKDDLDVVGDFEDLCHLKELGDLEEFWGVWRNRVF